MEHLDTCFVSFINSLSWEISPGNLKESNFLRVNVLQALLVREGQDDTYSEGLVGELTSARHHLLEQVWSILHAPTQYSTLGRLMSVVNYYQIAKNCDKIVIQDFAKWLCQQFEIFQDLTTKSVRENSCGDQTTRRITSQQGSTRGSPPFSNTNSISATGNGKGSFNPVENYNQNPRVDAGKELQPDLEPEVIPGRQRWQQLPPARGRRCQGPWAPTQFQSPTPRSRPMLSSSKPLSPSGFGLAPKEG